MTSIQYPQWLESEKATKRILQTLTNIKDLRFYLSNPDEYIRRLAILRLEDLKAKDAITLLKNILDDRLESPMNKELATMIIKNSYEDWDTSLFSAPAISKPSLFNDRCEKACGLSIKDATFNIKYDFSNTLLQEDLKTELDDVRFTNENDFSADFFFREWLSALRASLSLLLKNNLKKVFLHLLKGLLKLPKLLLFLPYAFLSQQCIKGFKKAKQKPIRTKLRNPSHTLTKTMSLLFENLLRILFFPLRVFLHHKRLFLAFIFIFYLLLTYTVQGRILTYRYLGTDLWRIQNQFIASTEEILSYAWNELKTITGIPTPTQTDLVAEQSTASSPSIHYRVTAKNGLNLRSAPSSSSDKVEGSILTYDTLLLSPPQTPLASGNKQWQYVITPDGRKGWVSAKWLKEEMQDDQ